MHEPLISVVVPNYNHAAYLEQRLASVFAQTYPRFEVIFLDDASTDHSLDIATRFAETHPMRIVPNTVNTGNPFAQWNRGVALARGEWVWIAESDDVASPRLLERLAALLASDSGLGLAYCASRRIDGAGRPGIRAEDNIRGLHPTRWDKDFVADGVEECRMYMSRLNTIANASAVLFRKHIYDAIGGADEGFRFAGDWDLWGRMMSVSRLAFVAEELNQHRLHPGTVRSRTSQERALAERVRVLLGIHQRHSVPAAIRREALSVLAAKAMLHLREGRLRPRVGWRLAFTLVPMDRTFPLRFLVEGIHQTLATHRATRPPP